MSIAADRLILLDTGVLIHLARKDPTGKAVEEEHELSTRPDRPLLSSVVEGEVLGFALWRGWGPARMRGLSVLFDRLARVDARPPEIVRAYAELFAMGRRSGKPCGQNDLWIAATAKVVNAVLLTCDRDFDWLHPEHVEVCYVSEKK